MASYEFITFRVETDDEGTQVVTVIEGGSHRGGVTSGRLTFSGGLDLVSAGQLHDLVAASVTMLVGGIQLSLLE